MAKKGTVTELASLFPAEEAQKASIRVQETIAERRRELDRLKSFIDDNTSVINLVRKLPDETHHNIMVPFGLAAFFPGRMTNPNKFLEGVVEIREDYNEEAPSITTPASVPGYKRSDGEAADEDEYARIFSRMAELEKEEEEAELEKEEEEAVLETVKKDAEHVKEEEDAGDAHGSDRDLEIQNEQKDNKHAFPDQEVRSILAATREDPVVSKEGAFHRAYPARNNVVANKDVELPQEEKITSPPPTSNTAFTGSIVEHAHNVGVHAPSAAGSELKARFKI